MSYTLRYLICISLTLSQVSKCNDMVGNRRASYYSKKGSTSVPQSVLSTTQKIPSVRDLKMARLSKLAALNKCPDEPHDLKQTVLMKKEVCFLLYIYICVCVCVCYEGGREREITGNYYPLTRTVSLSPSLSLPLSLYLSPIFSLSHSHTHTLTHPLIQCLALSHAILITFLQSLLAHSPAPSLCHPCTHALHSLTFSHSLSHTYSLHSPSIL